MFIYINIFNRMITILEQIKQRSNLDLVKFDFANDILVERFKEYIKQELPGLNANEFLNDIDKTGSAIAGSFMVKWITGLSFECGDIDLYEKIEDYESTVTYVNNQEEFKRKTPMTAILSEKYEFVWKKSITYSNTSYMTREFKRNEKNINVIGIPYIDIWTFIVESYDLDICKVAYHEGKIKVYNVQKLIEKKDIIRPPTLLSLAFYERSLPDVFSINEVINKQENRKEKYENRGFEIIKHNKTNDIVKNNAKILDLIKKNIIDTSNTKSFVNIQDNKLLFKNICLYYQLKNLDRQFE